MKYKKTLVIPLIFSLALILLTMTLALAQSGSSEENENEEDGKNAESIAVPSQVVLRSGGPDAFGYVYADSNESSCTTTFTDISAIGSPLGLTINGEVNVTTPFSYHIV